MEFTSVHLISFWLVLDILIAAVEIAVYDDDFVALSIALFFAFLLLFFLLRNQFKNLDHFDKLQVLFYLVSIVILTESYRNHNPFSFIFYFSNLALYFSNNKLKFKQAIGLFLIILLYHLIRIFFFIETLDCVIYILRHLLLFGFVISIISLKKGKDCQKDFEIQLVLLLSLIEQDSLKCVFTADGNCIYNSLAENILDRIVEIKNEKNDLYIIKEPDLALESFDPKKQTNHSFVSREGNQKFYSFVNAFKSSNREMTLRELIRHNQKRELPCAVRATIQNLIPEFVIFTTTLNSQNYTFIKISSEYQKQEEEKNMKETIFKSVYKVSHDMRTPLNAILNMLKCLVELIEPYFQERYLRPALSACQLLLNLLNDLLDLAQMEKNKIRLKYSKFKIQKILPKLLNMFAIQAEKKSIAFKMEFDGLKVNSLCTDKQRLKQILINLVSNALKFTKPQGVITVSFVQIEPEIIEVEVSDTGMGIKDQEIKNLFQDFYKVNDQENIQKNPNGVGLGLQISQELALLMGPKNSKGIEVKSIYGQGTTFTFQIQNQIELFEENLEESKSEDDNLKNSPLINLNNAKFLSSNCNLTSNMLLPKIKFPESEEKSVSVLSQHKIYQSLLSSLSSFEQQQHYLSLKKSSCDFFFQILGTKWMEDLNGEAGALIVDDDEFNILALQFMLEKLNLISDSAISGKEALKKVMERAKKNAQYQIIFLDIEMPEMNGEQTAIELLKIDKHLKIVPCSGYDQKQMQENWVRIGMLKALSKPIDKKKLKEMLEHLFSSLMN